MLLTLSQPTENIQSSNHPPHFVMCRPNPCYFLVFDVSLVQQLCKIFATILKLTCTYVFRDYNCSAQLLTIAILSKNHLSDVLNIFTVLCKQINCFCLRTKLYLVSSRPFYPLFQELMLKRATQPVAPNPVYAPPMQASPQPQQQRLFEGASPASRPFQVS